MPDEALNGYMLLCPPNLCAEKYFNCDTMLKKVVKVVFNVHVCVLQLIPMACGNDRLLGSCI